MNRKPDKQPRRRTPRPMPEPDDAGLQAAALTYLARYAATEAGLARVLQRRVDRWARQSDAGAEAIAAVIGRARSAIAAIVARLAGSGAVSDTAFAQSRARSLARAGRSGRAIGAHLSGKGVSGDLVASAAKLSPRQELAAALIHCRKRRLGPWRKADVTPELRRRELSSLARAGYQQAVSVRALGLERDEAEDRIIAFRNAL